MGTRHILATLAISLFTAYLAMTLAGPTVGIDPWLAIPAHQQSAATGLFASPARTTAQSDHPSGAWDRPASASMTGASDASRAQCLCGSRSTRITLPGGDDGVASPVASPVAMPVPTPAPDPGIASVARAIASPVA